MTGIRWKKTMVFQKGTEEDDTNFTVEIKGDIPEKNFLKRLFIRRMGKDLSHGGL